MVNIELVYALPYQQKIIALQVPVGSSVAAAIIQSNILSLYPELDLSALKVGIFSRRVTLDTVLQAGDRIEIYRSLRVDPKESRRLRARR